MTINKQMLGIYSDYLLTSFSYITSTGLSKATNGQISNDKISRFLGGSHQVKDKLEHTEYTSRDLWLLIKDTLREDEFEDGILIIDDTVEEKKYTDENEVICYHFDHTEGRNIKGVNMLNYLYLGKELVTPLDFEVIKKPLIVEKEVVSKVGKNKGQKVKIKTRKSIKTKNEIVQEKILQAIKNQVKFKYALMDIWFACNETLELLAKHKKFFVVPLKSNRKVALSKKVKLQGKWLKLEDIELDTDSDNPEQSKPVEIWLEGLSFPVLLTKQVFTNKDGSTGIMYLVTNDLSLKTSQEIFSIYQKRWKIEEFYKSLKSNLAFSKAPTKNTFTQVNHFFCSIYAYLQTEILLKTTNFSNHFQLKSSLYLKALQSAMRELTLLKTGVSCER